MSFLSKSRIIYLLIFTHPSSMCDKQHHKHLRRCSATLSCCQQVRRMRQEEKNLPAFKFFTSNPEANSSINSSSNVWIICSECLSAICLRLSAWESICGATLAGCIIPPKNMFVLISLGIVLPKHNFNTQNVQTQAPESFFVQLTKLHHPPGL